MISNTPVPDLPGKIVHDEVVAARAPWHHLVKKGETLRIVVEVGCPTEESFANVQTAIERLRKIAAASARTGCPVEIVIHAGRAAYPSIPKAGDPAEDRTDVSVSRLLDEYDKAKDR